MDRLVCPNYRLYGCFLFQVWDVAEGNPVCVHTHDSIDAGAIFCAAFAPDEPFYIAAGGAKGKVNHHHRVPT